MRQQVFDELARAPVKYGRIECNSLDHLVFESPEHGLLQEVDDDSDMGRPALVLDDLRKLFGVRSRGPELLSLNMSHATVLGRVQGIGCSEFKTYVRFNKLGLWSLRLHNKLQRDRMSAERQPEWHKIKKTRRVFMHWAMVKYLVGMNGHRDATTFVNSSYFDDYHDKGDALHGSRCFQDLTILGNITPEVRQRLAQGYVQGEYDDFFHLLNSIDPKRVSDIVEKHGYKNHDVYERFDLFYYTLHRELGIAWLSREGMLRAKMLDD